MERSEVQDLYGGPYAEDFNAIWHESEMWGPEAAHHISTLSGLLTEGVRWLDVGCGTGWMLSKFPGVERAGMDLSPDMLAQARKANPDALFLRQGDICDDVPEWHDAWDLVSCNGAPWSYLTSMEEIHRVADNLAAWTAPGGRCLMGIFDITDYTGIETPYPEPDEPKWVDTPIITGVFWSFYDAAGLHQNMVAPAMGYWIELFSKHFRRVEIVRWPHDPPFIPVARRNLLASEKREPGDTTPAEVVFHPVPELEDGPVGPVDPRATSDALSRLASDEGRLEAGIESSRLSTADPVARPSSAASAATRAAIRERATPTPGPGDAPDPDPPAAPAGLDGVRDEVAALRAEVGEVRAAVVGGPGAARAGTDPFVGTPTARLVREVGRRLNPLRPSVWRKAGRRLAGRR